RRPAGRGRVALPGAPAPPRAGVGHGALGHDRGESARPLLQAHRRGEETARGGDVAVRAGDGGDRAGAPDRIGGRTMGLAELARRVGMRLRRRRFDRDLAEEMRLHLDLRAADARAAGVPPDEADAAARRRFGNATVLREESRDAWGWRWLEDLGKDARYGLRGVGRNPGFTLVAVLAFALGIGAHPARGRRVAGVLLRPLPYADPDRLVTILHGGTGPTAAANIYAWRAQCASFEALGAAEAWAPNLAGLGIDQPEKLPALRVTPDVLPLLGVPPALAPPFPAQQPLPGKEPVIVLGWDLWQQRFGGDPHILDRSVVLDGVSYAVIGVMPRGFKFAPFWVTTAQAWAPLVLGPKAGDFHWSTLRPFARLKP